MCVRLTVVFTGRVQGVGFRYTVCRIAEGRDVSGQVRNLPDGGVELIVEASRAAAKATVNAVQDEMAAYIRDVRVSESEPTGQYDGFGIAFF